MIQWTTTLSVVLLAAIAAVLSYKHMYVLVRRYGEARWSAALCPISVDGMIVVASMSLLADSRRRRRGGPLPWALLIVGSLASLAANVALSDPSTVGRLIAAWPSLALIGSYELLMRQIRHAAGAEPTHMGVISPEGSAHTSSSGRGGPSDEEHTNVPASPESSTFAHANGRRHEHAVAPGTLVQMPVVRPEQMSRLRPSAAVRRQAWAWAQVHRGADGSLPSGAEIAAAFSMGER